MCRIDSRLASIACAVLISAGSARADSLYVQTNLVSNIPGMAAVTDPNLLNPWGVSYSATSPFWVSDQVKGVATLYSLSGTTATMLTTPLPTIPNLGAAPPSVNSNGPTGEVSTSAPGITIGSSDFIVPGTGSKAAFIFANLDGSISAWRGLASSAIVASVGGASFTGLAIANSSSGARIYAADQNSGNVYVFNSSWVQVGTLTPPSTASLPAGFTAFNVQNINGTLFVTYANPNNPAGGIVDEFTPDGAFITQLIDDPGGMHLDSPWGLAVAPAGWGTFGGDLLVGNDAGNGTINAYSLSGVWQGQIALSTTGLPFSEGNLWDLSFGTGSTSGGSPNVLYFTSGLDSGTDGLLGALTVASPEPSSVVLALTVISIFAAGQAWRYVRRAPIA